jgi:hypothetical protein
VVWTTLSLVLPAGTHVTLKPSPPILVVVCEGVFLKREREREREREKINYAVERSV